MEVVAKRNCKWTVKGKTYNLEKGNKYKLPATIKQYVEASGLFEIIKSKTKSKEEEE